MSEVIHTARRAPKLAIHRVKTSVPATTTLGATVFYSLIVVISLTAIPYGSAEPWWKSIFQCGVFLIAAISIFDGRTSLAGLSSHWRLFLPVVVLMAYALMQTPGWAVGTPISADPFQTKLFAVQLASFLIVAALLIRYVDSGEKVLKVVDVLIAIGLASACFGVLRQLTQHTSGFSWPNLERNLGYAQFLNANHFAFLMEMILGLALGVVAARGVKGTRRMVYILAVVPMWIALVLSNSRAGIVSGLLQVILIGFLFSSRFGSSNAARTDSAAARLRRPVLSSVLVISLLLTAMVAVVYVGGDPLAQKIDAAHAELNPDAARTFALRQNIWQATWNMIKDHPVTGVGFGGFWMAVTKYHDASGDITPQQAHNDYLEFVASGGIVSLLIVAWFAFEFARSAIRKQRHADGLSRAVRVASMISIATIGIHSLVDFGLHIPINALVYTVLWTLATIDLRPNASVAFDAAAISE